MHEWQHMIDKHFPKEWYDARTMDAADAATHNCVSYMLLT